MSKQFSPALQVNKQQVLCVLEIGGGVKNSSKIHRLKPALCALAIFHMNYVKPNDQEKHEMNGVGLDYREIGFFGKLLFMNFYDS